MQGDFQLNSTETEGSVQERIRLTYQHNKNIKLLDWLVKVLTNNRLSSVLLNTGAQISVISDKYLRENFLHVDEYLVNELLDEPDPLRVLWGNETDISFGKYTVVNLCIGEGEG